MATYPLDVEHPTSDEVNTIGGIATALDTAANSVADGRKTVSDNASGHRIETGTKNLTELVAEVRDWADFYAKQKQFLEAIRVANERYKKTMDDSKATNEDLARAKKEVADARKELAAKQKAADEAKQAVEDAKADGPNSSTAQAANTALNKAIAEVVAARKRVDKAVAEVKRIQELQKQAKETWDAAASKAKEALGDAKPPAGPRVETEDPGSGTPTNPGNPTAPGSPSAPGTPSGAKPGGNTPGATKPSGNTPGATKPGGNTPGGAKPGSETPGKTNPDLSALTGAGQNAQQQPNSGQAGAPTGAAQATPAAVQAKPEDGKDKDTAGKESDKPIGSGPGGALTSDDLTAITGLNLNGPEPAQRSWPTIPVAAQQVGAATAPAPTPARPLSAAPPLVTGNSTGGLSTAAEVSGRTGTPANAYQAPPPATSTSAAHGSGTAAQQSGAGANSRGTSMPGGMPPMMGSPMGGPGGGGSRGRDEKDKILSSSSDPSVAAIQGDAALRDAVPHGTIARKE